MNLLVACEESQEVCKAFRKKGHNAFSCDIQRCSGGHPEWHVRDDVTKLIKGDCTFTTDAGTTETIEGKWDMIIAFPPCTHLAVSGAAHFEKKRLDGRQYDGIKFFKMFLDCDCDKVVIENPVNIIGGKYIDQWFPEFSGLPKCTQIIHPWMFGDNFPKATCLWEKGVPPLVPEVTEPPEMEYKVWTDPKTGKQKRQAMWFFKALTDTKTAEDRSRVRSKTFPGVARAMAEQWG